MECRRLSTADIPQQTPAKSSPVRRYSDNSLKNKRNRKCSNPIKRVGKKTFSMKIKLQRDSLTRLQIDNGVVTILKRCSTCHIFHEVGKCNKENEDTYSRSVCSVADLTEKLGDSHIDESKE